MLKAPISLGFTALVVLLLGGCAGPFANLKRRMRIEPRPALTLEDKRSGKESRTANGNHSSQEFQQDLKKVTDPEIQSFLDRQNKALQEFMQSKEHSEFAEDNPKANDRVEQQDKLPSAQNMERENSSIRPRELQQTSGRNVKRLLSPDVPSSNYNRLRSSNNKDQASESDARDLGKHEKKVDDPVKKETEVVPATHQESNEPKLGDWKKELGEAIRAVESHLWRERLEDDERARMETHLRLLYVAAGRRDEAVKPIRELDENEQAFWIQQIFGMTETLNTQGMPFADRRATLALRHLRMAIGHLAASSSLDVRNLAFSNNIQNFGHYTKYPNDDFLPDQQVLLYVEIDNFTVEEKPKGFETVLKGSYQIYDLDGYKVADHTFSPLIEICRNRRRDFFIPYRIYMPKTIVPGDYVLKLNVKDGKANKSGQGEIPFTIKKTGRVRKP